MTSENRRTAVPCRFTCESTKMLPIPPSIPGQNGWSSVDFPLFTSAPRAFSPRKNNHKTVRAAASCLSHEMPQELIMMTAPHVPTSPKRKHPPKVRHKHLRATAPNSSSTMDSHGKNNTKSIQQQANKTNQTETKHQTDAQEAYNNTK